MKLLPRTLPGRTALTIAFALLAFMLLSLGAAVYFIAVPIAQRSAEDFAAIVVSTARHTQHLPPDQRESLRRQVLHDHGLIIAAQQPALAEKTFDLPYYLFFRRALAHHAGQELKLIEAVEGPLIWVDVPVEDTTVRVGFDRRRVGANPPVVVFLAIAGGALLTWLISVTEVRRVGRPLERLAQAVGELGRGQHPAPLPVEGPTEIAGLAQAFNRMSSDIQALDENRTVIVAGISHDLRTPLTRLQLAVEMLSDDSDTELIAAIRRDLAEMNALIGQFLSFSRGLDDHSPVWLDIGALARQHAADLQRRDVQVNVHGCDRPSPYLADPVALGRLLGNLLDNAAHYGGGAPVDVHVDAGPRAVTLRICDRGSGIPPGQVETVFRPFVRLESARGQRTGGSGLGLAIVRQLAIKFGWTIRLLPRDGGGTVAEVVLPVHEQTGAR